MQIVTLQQIKWELNITHSAHDSRLTDLGDRVEGETLAYIGLGDFDALQAALAAKYDETEVSAYRLAPLQAAVLHMVKARFRGQEVKPADPFVAGLLINYRLPAFSAGSTE